jgi:uncharacterized protein YheU (UPF0270 family)
VHYIEKLQIAREVLDGLIETEIKRCGGGLGSREASLCATVRWGRVRKQKALAETFMVRPEQY